ncbi:hypothetical protein SLS60_006398 [Paraconiothyrium brasiliense]|uniref:Uncharacterized protein n=1 Tax=Paraconiothyrium brasiliense TaxID=300254 RepID=A0ABR3RB77_9PLEO
MATPPAIHLRVHDVGGNFVRLTQALDHSPQYAGQVGSHSVEDEFDRFKIWAGNIAAHRKGRRSLEYRLRDATHLRDEVNGLLTTLEQSLKDAVAIVKGEKTPWDALEDSDDDSDSASDASSDGGEETELKQLLDSIQSSVTCLFRLSMAIRDPASDDRLQRTITVDKSYFEDYDILHAKTKFPDCAEYLSQRLGRAISGRRQYLSYRELHHQKLAKKAELIGLEQPRTEHTTNSTEASPLPVARSNSLDVLDEDDTLSQTSYATSVNATIRVPPLPKQAREHEHFECPLCFMIVSIHTKAAWKYVNVNLGSDTEADNPDNMFTETSIPILAPSNSVPWKTISTSRGMLGFNTNLKLIDLHGNAYQDATHCIRENALKRHIGRHQEQLALFALPPNLEETDGDEGDDANSYDATLNVNEWQEEDMSDSDDSESVDASSIAEPPDPVQPERMLCLVCDDRWVHEEPNKSCPRCGSENIAPTRARWTRIDRRLVNPQALEEAREQFEEREDCYIVLRELTLGEIRKLANRTKEIRQAREVDS